MNSGRAPLRRRVLLAVLSPLVSLLLLEGILTVAGFRYEPFAALREADRFDELDTPLAYVADEELLWTLKPGSVVHDPGHGFRESTINSLGFRGGEPPAGKEDGEFRVLCLGDSVVFGLNLKDAETVPVRLEAALRAEPALAGRKVSVVNGAVPGFGAVQGLRALERLRFVEPDVVVFWFGMNDAKPARGLPDSGQKIGSGVLRRVGAALGGLRTFQLARGLVSGFETAPAGRSRVGVEEYAERVERLGGEGSTVFVRYPHRLPETIRDFETLVRRAEEEGVEKVWGPDVLLSAQAPAPASVDRVGVRTRIGNEEGVLFGGPRPEAAATLAYLRTNLARLRSLRENLDARLARLPEGSLDASALFGAAAPEEVFSDNCHLSPRGAALAAEALAREIAGRQR